MEFPAPAATPPRRIPEHSTASTMFRRAGPKLLSLVHHPPATDAVVSDEDEDEGYASAGDRSGPIHWTHCGRQTHMSHGLTLPGLCGLDQLYLLHWVETLPF